MLEVLHLRITSIQLETLWSFPITLLKKNKGYSTIHYACSYLEDFNCGIIILTKDIECTLSISYLVNYIFNDNEFPLIGLQFNYLSKYHIFQEEPDLGIQFYFIMLQLQLLFHSLPHSFRCLCHIQMSVENVLQ